jgi:hypothetical protein
MSSTRRGNDPAISRLLPGIVQDVEDEVLAFLRNVCDKHVALIDAVEIALLVTDAGWLVDGLSEDRQRAMPRHRCASLFLRRVVFSFA